MPRGALLGVLAACPRLRPLLLVQWQRKDWDSYAAEWISSAYDARFVIGLYDDYWADWEGGARGPPYSNSLSAVALAKYERSVGAYGTRSRMKTGYTPGLDVPLFTFVVHDSQERMSTRRWWWAEGFPRLN
ncbi:hypothetical protein B0H14DRAFT_3697845 [Mycena olivaceomarginata]|nr:hypothetical protein B0H14DRAFT_3697845 [Mycena olivaceomarginata]